MSATSIAAELREAIEHLEEGAYTNYSEAEVRAIVIDAARERLAQLERDPELLERIRLALDSRWRYRKSLTIETVSHIEMAANRVLTALTPTGGS